VVLSRTRVAVLVAMVVAALGIGLMGAVGSASPKDDDQNNNKEGNLTVLVKNREASVVDLDPQGSSQGDMRVVNAPLYNASGKQKVGRFDLVCVSTDPAEEANEKYHMAQCTYTYTLAGGEITAQGVAAFPKLSKIPPTVVDAVSGGTGKYAGVRGEVSLQTRANKAISTFHFVD
jgi:allene oxide cyclase-like protein